jgi:hypothetical protein
MTLDLVKPALAGAVGTTGMTLFSIVTSERKKHQFREHELLSELLKITPLSKNSHASMGWIGHFITEIIFNTINQNVLKAMKKRPDILNGLILGAVNGLVGIAIWKMIFELHPSPPKINLTRYLSHLMLAHLVFAVLSNVSTKGLVEKSPETLNAYKPLK